MTPPTHHLIKQLALPPGHVAAWLATLLPDPVLRPLTRLANRFTGAAVRATVHDPTSVPPEVRAEMVREAGRPGAALGYTCYNQATVGRHGMTNDFSALDGGIDSPALFFHGREDGLVDPEESRRAAAAMPDARLCSLTVAGTGRRSRHAIDSSTRWGSSCGR